MFDIGVQELIVIFIVILLVFGPKRAPELGRALGKALAELKRSFHDIKKQVETEFKESTSDIQEAKRSFEELRTKFESGVKETIGMNTIQQPIKDVFEEIDETEDEKEEEEDEEENLEEKEEDLVTDEKEKKDINNDKGIQNKEIREQEGLNERR
ncbi:MAG: Sec-independent protein translocase protein TatB [Thermodesulfovibrionales bacterium]